MQRSTAGVERECTLSTLPIADRRRLEAAERFMAEDWKNPEHFKL